MRQKANWRAKAGICAAVVALVLTACTASPQPAPTTTAAAQPATFNFGTGGDPAGLDPALTSDTESYRVTRQVLEGLVTVNATTGDPAPSLATNWTTLNDGLAYSFTLRPNVKFQDGTDFNAAAVCANFQRWYTFPKSVRGDGSQLAFQQVFKAFSDDAKDSLYNGCTTPSANVVEIKLNQPITGFLQAMTLPGFAISSPKALTAAKANVLNQTVAGNKVSSYALHPVGTGPYTFKSWKDGEVTMVSNKNYWGQKGQIQVLNFIVYDQPEARLQALLDGQLDGYDPVTAGNFDELVKSGTQILQRDPFSVMYLGINQAIPALQDLKVREAIAMAIDKNSLVSNFFIEGTTAATQFIPPKLSSFNSAVTDYPYNPTAAAALLKSSSYKGQPLKFYYPTNVTRVYLPTPAKVYAQIARELTAVGFNIQPVPVNWNDNYTGQVTTPGDHALDLMGWNGGYSDPDNFVGPIFGSNSGEFDLNDPQLISKIDRARGLPAGTDRTDAYQSISQQIATTVPAVPIAFPISAVALSARVKSYPISPVLNEVFNKVTLNY